MLHTTTLFEKNAVSAQQFALDYNKFRIGLIFEDDFTVEDGSKLEGNLVADGASSGEFRVEIGLSWPEGPRFFLLHDENIVTILAHRINLRLIAAVVC